MSNERNDNRFPSQEMNSDVPYQLGRLDKVQMSLGIQRSNHTARRDEFNNSKPHAQNEGFWELPSHCVRHPTVTRLILRTGKRALNFFALLHEPLNGHKEQISIGNQSVVWPSGLVLGSVVGLAPPSQASDSRTIDPRWAQYHYLPFVSYHSFPFAIYPF